MMQRESEKRRLELFRKALSGEPMTEEEKIETQGIIDRRREEGAKRLKELLERSIAKRAEEYAKRDSSGSGKL